MENRDLMFNILLNTHIYNIQDVCDASKLASNICSSNFFWKTKSQHDFGINTLNGRDPVSKREYFKVFELHDRLVVTDGELDFWKSYEKILDRLKYLESESKLGHSQVFFYGVDTKGVTNFGDLSNRLEIGTIAKNNKVGNALLIFLSVIINNDFEATDRVFTYWQEEEGELITVSKFIANSNDFNASDTFMTDDVFSRSMYQLDITGKGIYQKVEKYISDVDIWTLKRIEKRLRKLHFIVETSAKENNLTF
jgi:hypothetical protein